MSWSPCAVGSASSVTLLPEPGGLTLDVELDRVTLGMHLAYSVVCLDGASDLTITASHIKVAGMLGVGVRAGAFDIALTGQTVELTGTRIDLTGLPGDVVARATSRSKAPSGPLSARTALPRCPSRPIRCGGSSPTDSRSWLDMEIP